MDWLVEAARVASGGRTLGIIKERMRALARKAYPDANVREVHALTEAGLAIARKLRLGLRPRYEDAMRVENAVKASMAVRRKRAALREALAGPCVFYAVSTHQKPRDSHRAYQGAVAYDRAYRRKLTEAGKWYAVRDVEVYIRRNGLPSVQKLSGPPDYVGTAPNCRHRFVPLDTEKVLDGTAETVVPDGAHRSLSDAKRYRLRKARLLRAEEATKRKKPRR